MRLVRILGNLCLSLLISLMAVSLSAWLREIANLREQSSLGGTKLARFSLAVVRSQVFTDGRWKSQWMTLALLNNHSAPLWFHTPAVVSVLVEPCEDVSEVKLGIEMARFIVWREVETLSWKVYLYDMCNFTVEMSGFDFPTVMSAVLKNLFQWAAL